MKTSPPKLFRTLFSVLIPLVFLTSISAERLPVKIYTSADGLGSSFVDSVFSDSRGFMWFSTRDGLSRFDGSRFVTYQVGEKDAPPGIEMIYETRDGNYWISTTGGLFRFDPNRISPTGAGGTPRIDAEYVSGWRGTVFEDSRGNVWLASGGIFHLEKKDGKDEFVKVDWNLPPRPNITFVAFQIFEAGDGSLLVNTTWGLIRRLPDGRILMYQDDKVLLGGSGTVSMILDKSGRVWLARDDQLLVLKLEPAEAFAQSGPISVQRLEPTALFELRPGENVPLPKKGGEIFQLTNPALVEDSTSMRLLQTSDGTVWIVAEKNLLEIRGGVLQIHSAGEGLPNAMGRMGEDAAGNLWIGGYAGLARLDRQGLITYGPNDGAVSARFFAVNEDRDGDLYFANSDSYISRFDGKGFQNVRPAIEANPRHFWTSRHVFRSSNGDWWFLTNGSLYRFSGVADFAGLNGRRPTRTYTEQDGLKSTGIYQIFEDSGGDIWVSTRGLSGDGHGLARLKKGDEKFYSFSEAEDFPSQKSPSCFAEDRHGNIWFGFYEGGLARFDGERFESFSEDDGLPEGLLSDLHLDGKGRLWIGSTIGGLLRLDDTSAKKPSFAYLTVADGLSSNNVRTITEDRFGRVYVGTARGVDRLSPDTGHIKHYSVNDGLAADFVVDSHCDKNGDLWFATNDGVSRLIPLPDERSSPPRVFIGGLRIAGVDQPVSDLGDGRIEREELSHIENNLQIEFFGLDFRAGETLRYQYKLEGADADWSAPTEQRTVNYANLQPAAYRFLVRAVNSEGVASDDPAVIEFRILPPIWARWWFIALCALGAALIITGIYRYRLNRLREVNEALEDARLAEENLRKSREERLAELERVRSRIATDLHDDIGASLTQIAVLSEVAQAQSRNGISEPLRAISSVSNELVESMSDIVWSINPAKDHFSDLTQRMRRFASDVLTARGIGLQFHASHAFDQTVVNSNVRREVFLIFKESINNVVKHSGAKKVGVEIGISDDLDLRLEISDDGRGFAPDAAEIPAAVEDPGDFGGNGLPSIKKRAAEMNGRIEVISEPGRGTTVILIQPLDSTTRTGGDAGVRA
ncbi:MAG: two-component regulator propeller domain-containing protein [Pyrinomonadaceae bacterium]